MKPILMMLALAMLITAGCAAQQQPDQDAILDCNSYADGQVKARYTPDWDQAVQQCLKTQEQ